MVLMVVIPAERKIRTVEMMIETAQGDMNRWWEVRWVQPKNEKVELKLLKVEKVHLGLKKVGKVTRTHQVLLGRCKGKQKRQKIMN